MDFRSLSRKELQGLCKKNKIPANMTNVAMADALAALSLVEGVEEFLNAKESEAPESPEKEEIVCSEIPRTAFRTSTRRKAIKEEPKSLQPLTRTRRGTGSKCAEEPDQENKDLNAAFTPALRSGRRRTAAASACKKVDFQMTINTENENKLGQEKSDIPEMSAVLNSQKRVATASARRKTEPRNNGTTEQRTTRRSIRLLEKNMESLSLKEGLETERIAVHLSFEEIPEGPMEETNIEIGPEKTDDPEGESDTEQNVSTAVNDMELEIDGHERNETKAEPDMNPEISTSAAKLVNGKSSDDEIAKDLNDYETEIPENNLDMEEEASKDNNAPELAEDANNATKFSLPPVDVSEVDSLSTLEKSGTKMEESQDENTFESEDPIGEDFEYEADIEEAKIMDNSAKLSPPHENLVEETEDEVISNAELVMKVEDAQNEYICESESKIGRELEFGDKGEALDAGFEEDKKEMEMASVQDEVLTMISMEDKDDTIVDGSAIQTGGALHHEETCNKDKLLSSCLVEKPSSAEMADHVSEDLVDVTIQFLMDESPGDMNDTLDSHPKMLENTNCETLVDVSITQIEELPISSNGISLAPFAADQLAGQFPRPTITKSPVKEQTTKLQIDISDGEEEKQGNQEQVEQNDLSLRQLRKMIKELQLGKKKMDNKSTVGKVRTALQPLPENRMDKNELEKRF